MPSTSLSPVQNGCESTSYAALISDISFSNGSIRIASSCTFCLILSRECGRSKVSGRDRCTSGACVKLNRMKASSQSATFFRVTADSQHRTSRNSEFRDEHRVVCTTQDLFRFFSYWSQFTDQSIRSHVVRFEDIRHWIRYDPLFFLAHLLCFVV